MAHGAGRLVPDVRRRVTAHCTRTRCAPQLPQPCGAGRRPSGIARRNLWAGRDRVASPAGRGSFSNRCRGDLSRGFPSWVGTPDDGVRLDAPSLPDPTFVIGGGDLQLESAIYRQISEVYGTPGLERRGERLTRARGHFWRRASEVASKHQRETENEGRVPTHSLARALDLPGELLATSVVVGFDLDGRVVDAEALFEQGLRVEE